MKNVSPTYKYVEIANGFIIHCTASLEVVQTICDLSTTFLDSKGYNAVAMQDIELGLYEALSNAVRHGAAKARDKTIDFTLRCRQSTLDIKVKDQGPGFNWKKALKKRPSPLAKSGRGLTIMRNCFDSINYNTPGNELKLQIRTKGCMP